MTNTIKENTSAKVKQELTIVGGANAPTVGAPAKIATVDDQAVGGRDIKAVSSVASKIMPDNDYKKLRAQAAKGLKLTNEQYHALLMRGLFQFYAHLNTTCLTEVVNNLRELSPAMFKQAKEWTLAFSPSRWDDESKEHPVFKLSKAKIANVFNLEKAFENPFHTVKVMTNREVKALLTGNIMARIENMVKQIDKELDSNEELPEIERKQMRAVQEYLKVAVNNKDNVTALVA